LVLAEGVVHEARLGFAQGRQGLVHGPHFLHGLGLGGRGPHGLEGSHLVDHAFQPGQHVLDRVLGAQAVHVGHVAQQFVHGAQVHGGLGHQVRRQALGHLPHGVGHGPRHGAQGLAGLAQQAVDIRLGGVPRQGVAQVVGQAVQIAAHLGQGPVLQAAGGGPQQAAHILQVGGSAVAGQMGAHGAQGQVDGQVAVRGLGPRGQAVEGAHDPPIGFRVVGEHLAQGDDRLGGGMGEMALRQVEELGIPQGRVAAHVLGPGAQDDAPSGPAVGRQIGRGAGDEGTGHAWPQGQVHGQGVGAVAVQGLDGADFHLGVGQSVIVADSERQAGAAAAVAPRFLGEGHRRRGIGPDLQGAVHQGVLVQAQGQASTFGQGALGPQGARVEDDEGRPFQPRHEAGSGKGVVQVLAMDENKKGRALGDAQGGVEGVVGTGGGGVQADRCLAGVVGGGQPQVGDRNHRFGPDVGGQEGAQARARVPVAHGQGDHQGQQGQDAQAPGVEDWNLGVAWNRGGGQMGAQPPRRPGHALAVGAPEQGAEGIVTPQGQAVGGGGQGAVVDGVAGLQVAPGLLATGPVEMANAGNQGGQGQNAQAGQRRQVKPGGEAGGQAGEAKGQGQAEHAGQGPEGAPTPLP
jgi:hypothetical protein